MASIGTGSEPIHNVAGATVFVCYVLAALFLSTLIVIDLCQSYSARPSPSTNQAKNSSNRLQIFVALAILSFSILSYHMLTYLIYSYQKWATSNNLEALPGLYVPSDIFTISSLHFLRRIWQWLTESTLFLDFAETICLNSANFWWTQQALLVTMASALFISIEGEHFSSSPQSSSADSTSQAPEGKSPMSGPIFL